MCTLTAHNIRGFILKLNNTTYLAIISLLILNSPQSPRRVGRAGGEKTRNPKQWQDQGNRQEEERVEEEPIQNTVPKGTCQTMCPVREIRLRESQNRLHHFEMLAGTRRDRQPRVDPLRAVKEYARPAAGKDATNPCDLRPPAVLMKTVCYLIDDIAASQDLHPWTEVYSFVFDRLRAVKQDMIIQRLSGMDCVTILERTVRFLIFSSYRLCGEPLRLYDPQINHTHLQENLSWLLDCYAIGPEPYANQEEFEALSLLYNLGCTRAMQHILQLPGQIRRSPDVSLALSINRAFLERNPVRLLRLSRKLNFLQTCAVHRHLITCRKDLLLIYSHGFSSRNCRFPLDKLSHLLDFNKQLTARYCQIYGVVTNQENQVVFLKTAFTEPEHGKEQCLQYHNAEKLKVLTVGCIVHGSFSEE